MSASHLKARFRSARPRVMVSVHRGYWDPLPENSVAGIRAASAWDVVEIDVQLDDAGRPYIMHDETLERTTGHALSSDGAPADLLPRLRLKEGAGGDAADLTEERLPYIEDAFAALQGDAIFDLDVKRDRDVETVAAYVAQLGVQDRATLKIDVENEGDITRLRGLEDRYDIMVMAKLSLHRPEDVSLMEALATADVAMAEASFETPDLLARACEIGGDKVGVGVFTLDGIHCCQMCDARALEDPDAIWGHLIDAGVAQIMTDRPDALTAYLATR